MSSSTSTCTVTWRTSDGPTACGKSLPAGQHICTPCAQDAAGRLRDIPDTLDTLDVTIARQDRFRRDVVRRVRDDDHDPNDQPELGAHGALPLNPDAADRRTELVDELVRWARVGHTRAWPGIPYVLPAPVPADPVGAAAWLADHLAQLVREPWVATMVVRIDRRVRRAEQVCDRPDDRVRVTCPTCGHQVPLSADPTERIECRGWIPTTDGTRIRCTEWGTLPWWVERCAPSRAPVRAGLLPLRMEAHGWRIEPATVRQWISRGKLAPVGTENGHPTYDIAQAVAVASAAANRRRTGRAV